MTEKTLNQLNLFEQPSPRLVSLPQVFTVNGCDFKVGERVRVAKAVAPLDRLNGRLGQIVEVTPKFASVQLEGVAVAVMLRVEAIEKVSKINTFVLDEELQPIEIGSSVSSEEVFLGQVGTVRRIEPYCGAIVAWVDYGGKPLYPAALESLSLA